MNISGSIKTTIPYLLDGQDSVNPDNDEDDDGLTEDQLTPLVNIVCTEEGEYYAYQAKDL